MLANPPKTVLLVEDAEDDVLMFKIGCKKAEVSFALQVAHDGGEAIDYLSGSGIYADRAKYPIPSLIVLDINMPRISGFEVLEWIRRKSDCRNLCVVMFTSSRFDTDVERAYELRANSYVVKPCVTKDRLEVITSFDRFWLKINRVPESSG